MPSGRQAAGALLARLRLLASGSRGLATCSGTTVASQGRLAVCEQAEAAARSGLLDGAQLIVSSPYTRCMQTAAIISRLRNLPLTVDIDLHEFPT